MKQRFSITSIFCIVIQTVFYSKSLNAMIPEDKIFKAVRSIDKESEDFIKKLFSNQENKELLNLQQIGSYSLLHLAVLYSTLEMVNTLLDSGIDVNIRNDENETALHYAVQRENNSNIINLLLKRGAKVNVVDSSEKTPLHWAAENGRPENILLLRKAGANPNTKDLFDKTPADRAFCGNPVIKQQVLDALNGCKF